MNLTNEHLDRFTTDGYVVVEGALSGMKHGLVWDLGSNTGTYSRLLAGCADHVVAFAADLAVAEGFYVALRQEGPENILPLFSNLADPSPGLGWRGAAPLMGGAHLPFKLRAVLWF